MADANAQKPAEEYKTLWGARVLWPCDMPDDCMEDCISQAAHHMQDKNPDKDGPAICDEIKKAHDEKWGHSWVIVCGKNFGCHAIHEKQHFIYFTIGQHAFMMYKA